MSPTPRWRRRDGAADQRGQRERVRSYVEDAPDEVDVAFRGERPDGDGLLVSRRRSCCRVGPGDPVWREEIFGPVVAVMPFDDEADAVAKANDTAYGLSGSIWTRDLGRALRVSRGIEAGNLSVNSPQQRAVLHAVRGVQAVRAGPRARTRRAGCVHGRQERLPLHRLTAREGRARGLAWQDDSRDGWPWSPAAGSGIGLATVRRFAQEGARVVIGDVDEVGGKAAAEEVGGAFVPLRRDRRRSRSTRCSPRRRSATAASTSPSTTRASPRPTTTRSSPPTSQAWRRVQEVNLTSVYLCCKAALPYMLEQGRGSIINTASFVAVMGAATSQISYTASKGGVLSMSRELGVQFAREGVRVNALCPGPVNTPLLQELFAKDPERAARRLVHIPVGRFAEPEEIANAVLFLASDESSFITASKFLVDGGITGAYVTPL